MISKVEPKRCCRGVYGHEVHCVAQREAGAASRTWTGNCSMVSLGDWSVVYSVAQY